MTIRTPVGQPPVRHARWRVPVILVAVAVVLMHGLGAGQLTATLAEGDETMTGDPVATDPASAPTSEPILTEPPSPTSEPTATTPSMEMPPTEAPNSVPTATLEPISTAEPTPVVEPTPAIEPTSTSEISKAQPVVIPRGDGAFSTASVENCSSASGSEIVEQGEELVYTCAFLITVDLVPTAFNEIDLLWTVSATIDAGWTVQLRSEDGTSAVWEPATAGTSAILARMSVPNVGRGDETLDDVNGNTLTYTGNVDVRLVAPTCGGPIDPTVTLTSSAVTVIDGGSPVDVNDFPDTASLTPMLNIVAPTPGIARRSNGAVNKPDDPLSYSHASQVVDAGTMNVTVLSGYCGGWNVSISASDFVPVADGVAFGAANLALTGISAGAGSPAPVATSLLLSNASQSLVSAANRALVGGTYTYAFNLDLTIPGGTLPGTYTSTLTVTTSAAP